MVGRSALGSDRWGLNLLFSCCWLCGLDKDAAPGAGRVTRGARVRAHPTRSSGGKRVVSPPGACDSEARRRPGACRGAEQPRPAHGGGLAEGGQGPRDVAPEPPGALDAAGLPGFCYAALHPEPEVGSEPLLLVKWERTFRPQLPGRGAGCATIRDTQIPGWSQPHPAALLKPRRA